MKRVFVIQVDKILVPIDWEEDMMKKIEKLSPDLILLESSTEASIFSIFKKFFPLINEWAKNNNAECVVLNPYFNQKIDTNIRGEITLGNLLPTFRTFCEGTVKQVSWIRDTRACKSVYACLNARPAEDRFSLFDKLAKYNMLQGKEVVSIKGTTKYDWKHYKGGDISVEDFSTKPDWNDKISPQFYKLPFMEIVSETNPNVYHCTEKTLRPLWHLKPFLVNTCKHYHTKYLARHFGLKLYDEVFNYDFDSVDDMDLRQEMLVKEVQKVYNTTIKERRRLWDILFPKLMYNRNRLQELYSQVDRLPPVLNFMKEDHKIVYGEIDDHYLFLHGHTYQYNRT